MRKAQYNKKKKFKLGKCRGFSVLEVILSAAIFCVFSSSAVTFLLTGLKAEQQAVQAKNALYYASEGLEAVRAMRDISFENISDTTGSGLRFSDGQWRFAGEYDEFENYRRVISIFPVRRDSENNIILNGGHEDSDMKKITAQVFWTAPSSQTVSVELNTYLSRWK